MELMRRENFYPQTQNLGKSCMYWNLRGRLVGCNFPKAEMEGRTSCEGIIDEVCLYLKDRGPLPTGLSKKQIRELKTRIPDPGQKPYIPPA